MRIINYKQNKTNPKKQFSIENCFLFKVLNYDKRKKRNLHGIIEQDAAGNFFCGPYLLDYKMQVLILKWVMK